MPYDELFDRLEQENGLPTGYLNQVAQVESNYNPHSHNELSGADGLFQFIRSTARQYGLRYGRGPGSTGDPVASATAAARLAADNQEHLRATLGRAPTIGELYVAHQQGGGGASALMAHPNAPAGAVVPSRNISDNAGNPRAPAGQFVQKWASKFVEPEQDLLSEWTNPKKTAAPQSEGDGTITIPRRATPEEDLLSEWTKPSKDEKPGTAIATKESAEPKDEHISQYVARKLAEHQGTDIGDTAVRGGLGVLRGMGDVADTLGMGITGAGRAGANALSTAGVISPETAGTVGNWANRVQGNIASGNAAFDEAAANSPLARAGRVAGQVIATAPFAEAGAAKFIPYGAGAAEKALIGGSIGGATSSALTSSSSDLPFWLQTGLGAAGGAALAPVAHGVSAAGAGALNRLVGIDPERAALAETARNQFGIPITAGQMSSSYAGKLFDSVMQRIPFSGYSSRTAEQLAGAERAVAEGMGNSTGRVTDGTVEQAKKTAYIPYNAAKDKMGGKFGIDKDLIADLQNTHNEAHAILEGNLPDNVDKHIANIFAKIKNGEIDADALQNMTHKDSLLNKVINSNTNTSRFASQIKDALENFMGRADPNLKKLKDAADYKYFVAKAAEQNLKEGGGTFSPLKLLKNVDYSRGDIGTVGRIAQQFMKELPSSNTAERLAAAKAIGGAAVPALGLGGLGAATYFDPESWQRNALLGAGAFAAGRAGSAALRSNWLANSLIGGALSRSINPSAQFVARNAPLSALPTRAAITVPIKRPAGEKTVEERPK